MIYRNNIFYQDQYKNVFLFTGKRRKAGKNKGWEQIVMLTPQGLLTTYVKNKKTKKMSLAKDKLICHKLTGLLMYIEFRTNPVTTGEDWAWWNENYLL